MLILDIISIFLFLTYAILINYYRQAWKELPYFEFSKTESPTIKFSIIVPVRNEEKNITRLLEHLSLQSYPKHLYQVIIVDDHSTDSTWQVLNQYMHPEMELFCLRLADFKQENANTAYKKWAIETGISKATGEWIITTDADCEPGPDWLWSIAAFQQSTQSKMIAAPVKINLGNSLLTIFQTLDFITLQGITGASVYKKIHSMCNGANLAYEKKAFVEVNGFRDIDKIPSGDDMFLMHKIYTKYPEQVFFLKNKNAIVPTAPETSLSGFIHQRVRWASKADKYQDQRIFWALLLVYLLNLVFAALLIASFWHYSFLFLLILLLLLKTIVEYPFVKSAALFFDQETYMSYFLWFQPIHILYTIIIGAMGKFGSYRWKGRKVG